MTTEQLQELLQLDTNDSKNFFRLKDAILDLKNNFVSVGILYADLVALKATSSLVPNTIYYITDRKIWIKALNTSELAVEGNRLETIVIPNYYVIAGSVLGVWNATLTPIVDDYVVWGTKVWSNILGNVGTAISNLGLDPVEWLEHTLVDVDASGYYEDKLFGCHYNIDTDQVVLQWDERNNFVHIPTSVDWGNAAIYGNTAFGVIRNNSSTNIADNNCVGPISNNSNTGEIAENNCGSILNNSNIGDILSNNIHGSISSNTNVGGIENNSINEDISNNANNGGIINNSNNGGIFDNSNVGVISLNTNNGSIDSNSNADDIKYNNNIGNIVLNTNDGAITNNSNIGDISNNSNLGEIYRNSNKGVIGSNTNKISGIESNTNVGDIISNDSVLAGPFSIKFNTNNGYIISPVRVANVLGTIVNL